MTTHGKHAHGERGDAERGPGYEQSDINVPGVAIFAVVVAVSSAVLMAAMVWLYGEFRIHEVEADRARPPATRAPLAGPTHPPDPVIQGAPGSRFELQDPSVEMAAQLAKVEEILSTSGWVDRNAGTVRIPIEQAKKLLLERGLPVREDRAREARP